MSGTGGGGRLRLVGWVFLNGHGPDGITVRWKRGDPVAYVLDGHRLGDHSTVAGILDTVPVTPAGWTDLAEIRLLGQRWTRQR